MANDFFNDVLPMDQSGMDFLKTGNVPDAGSSDWGFNMGGAGQGDNSFNFLSDPKFNTGQPNWTDMIFGKGQQPGAIGGIGSLASALFSMPAARKNAAAMQDIANQQKFYNDQLQQSYTNPSAYLNSPEGRALRSSNAQAIARAAAAKGLRSQTGAQMNALDQIMMGNLDKYRNTLRSALSPEQQRIAQMAAQKQSPAGTLMAGLASLFGNPSGAAMLKESLPYIAGAGKSILGGLGGLGAGLSSLFSDSPATPDLSFADLGKGFMDLPSIDEIL